MKAISICRPLTGGIHSVFLSLRRALFLHEIELTWVSAGRSIARDTLAQATAEDLACGALIATETDDELSKAKALLGYFEAERSDVAIVHVLGGPMETNLVRYLPSRVRRILIVHNITVATYRAARSIRDHVHATVGVSPRIVADLIGSYGFPPAWTRSIPNAIDVPAFSSEPRNAGGPELRVLSLGRVEHGAKGVLWIPEIARKAAQAGANLVITIAGTGPDLPALKALFQKAGLHDRVRYLGSVARADVPRIMASHDVFLFPSVFEGFGLSLVEAMAAGCVPIASRIRGVTDAIVDAGQSGYLFPVGNSAVAAGHLVGLWRDRRLFSSLSSAAREAARRFDLPALSDSYFNLLQEVARSPREVAPPMQLANWRMSPYLRPGWRSLVPGSVKGALRMFRERL